MQGIINFTSHLCFADSDLIVYFNKIREQINAVEDEVIQERVNLLWENKETKSHSHSFVADLQDKPSWPWQKDDG